MSTEVRRMYLNVLLAALGIFALYFAGLGSYPLLDRDEPVYGQFVKEMAYGDWLTPHYLGKIIFDKPPLTYWLMSSSVRIFGQNEFALRLPSAIMAVFLIFIVYLLASFDYGRRVGVLSALVMATCVQQAALARACVTDITFAVFLIAALYFYRRWIDAENRLIWPMLCGVSAGFAMLTKGPIGPFLIFGMIFIHLLITGRLRRLISAGALLGVFSGLAVGMPWFAAMYVIHGDLFVQDFIVMHHLSRFTNPLHASQTGSWTSYFRNFMILLVFFYPWSLFVPQAVVRAAGANRKNEGAKLALVWIGVVFVFFSISKTQLVTYIFPMYPAASVLIGALWYLAENGDIKAQKGVRIALWIAFSMAVIIAVSLFFISARKFPDAQPRSWVGLMLVFAFGAAAILISVRRGLWSSAPWIIGAGMALFVVGVVFIVMPIAHKDISSRWVVETIPAEYRKSVVVFRTPNKVTGLPKFSGLVYYLGYEPHDIRKSEEVSRLLNSAEPVFIACRGSKNTERLKRAGALEWSRGYLAIMANQAAISNLKTHYSR